MYARTSNGSMTPVAGPPSAGRPYPPRVIRPPRSAARAPVEKGKVESVEVVILDDVGVGALDAVNEAANEIRLRRVALAVRFEHFGGSVVVPNGNHEHSIALREESGRLQIELESMQLIEREIAKIRPAGCNEVLLLRRQLEHTLRR